MARFDVSGADALIAGLEDMVEQTPRLRDDILKAEADVIEPALRRSIVSEGLVRSGRLHGSIKRRKMTSAGIPVIRIGPKGEHHRYSPSSGKSGIVDAGYIGYIGEYGIKSRGTKGRNWLQKGLDKSRSAAFDAADAVYNDYMQNNNL